MKFSKIVVLSLLSLSVSAFADEAASFKGQDGLVFQYASGHMSMQGSDFKATVNCTNTAPVSVKDFKEMVNGNSVALDRMMADKHLHKEMEQKQAAFLLAVNAIKDDQDQEQINQVATLMEHQLQGKMADGMMERHFSDMCKANKFLAEHHAIAK